jgi:hypothetical protein
LNSNTAITSTTNTNGQLAGTTGQTYAVLLSDFLQANVIPMASTSGAGTETSNANGNLNSNSAITSTTNTNTTVDVSDDSLGEVVELIVDPQTGDVHYAIIEAGDQIGLASTAWIPVPLAQIHIVADPDGGDDFAIMIDRELLASAPSFEVGILPAMDAGWDAGLRDYWDIQ